MSQRATERLPWVRLRKHTTSASGGREPKVPITPSNLVGGPEKRKRLGAVAASKRSSEVVARRNRKCPCPTQRTRKHTNSVAASALDAHYESWECKNLSKLRWETLVPLISVEIRKPENPALSRNCYLAGECETA